MFYSHSEISMMSKSHMNDIRESCKQNCKYKIENKKNNKRSLLQVLLVTKVFTFLNK